MTSSYCAKTEDMHVLRNLHFVERSAPWRITPQKVGAITNEQVENLRRRRARGVIMPIIISPACYSLADYDRVMAKSTTYLMICVGNGAGDSQSG